MAQISSPGSLGRQSGESILQEKVGIQNATATQAVQITARIGCWSAMLAAGCSTAYGLAVIAVLVNSLSSTAPTQSAGWTGIEDFLAAFQPIQMLPVIPSLLLVPAFTALMVSIHTVAPQDKKIWSQLGLAFSLIYAALAGMNYLVQVLPVWRSINLGQTDGLAMFVLGNPHSIFWGLAYAYIFMNLGMLFSAMVFDGSPLAKRVRLLFILNGISGVVTIASAFLDSPQIYLLGSLVIWCPLFTAASLGAAVLFKSMIEK